MKTRTYFFSLILAFSFLTLSCNDDESPGVPADTAITPPNSFDFLNLRTIALDNLTQQFDYTIDENTGFIDFTSEKGVEVRIYTSCLTLGGQTLEGDIEVEFLELYERGNLMTTNVATLGKHQNGDLEMLVTGGAFYLNIRQNGVEIDNVACGIQMKVPTALTGGADYDMIMWYGNIDNDGDLVWEEAGNGAYVEIADSYYFAFLNQFGFTNIDRFYSDPRDRTTLLVDVPTGYSKDNSRVYLSYVGEIYGLSRLQMYENGMFSEHFGQIPIGLECHVIFLSEFEDQYVYAIKTVTVAVGEIVTISSDDLYVTTEEGITNHINSLP